MVRDAKQEQFWRGRRAEYEQSGVTVREFCAREGLRETQFYYWCRKLKAARQPQAGFVELVRSGGGTVGAGVSIRVDDRLSIAVERGFDVETLQATLACVCARGGAPR